MSCHGRLLPYLMASHALAGGCLVSASDVSFKNNSYNFRASRWLYGNCIWEEMIVSIDSYVMNPRAPPGENLGSFLLSRMQLAYPAFWSKLYFPKNLEVQFSNVQAQPTFKRSNVEIIEPKQDQYPSFFWNNGDRQTH